MEKRYLLLELIAFINKARKESNDTLIAKTMVENRYSLADMSIEDLSEKCYVSQPSMTRFTQKMGYKNFKSLKSHMDDSIHFLNFTKKNTSLSRDQLVSKIRDEVYEDIQEVNEHIKEMDLNRLMEFVDLVHQSKNIIILGSELSVSMAYMLQLTLLDLGKNVYTIYDINYQKEMVEKMQEGDMIICITVQDRWFNYFMKDAKNSLAASKATKVLFYIHENNELFDFTYPFGKTVKNNLGYHEEMYFMLLLNRVLRRM